MTKTFIQTKEFSKNWDRLGFHDSDLRRLESQLLLSADKFPIIQRTGGLRKMRFSYEREGKSGGVRVCYVDFVMEEVIYLITVYPKSEKDNLSQKERNEIKKVIDILRASL